MNVEIIDRYSEVKKAKPIELLYCLQTKHISEKSFKFVCDNKDGSYNEYLTKGVRKIERILKPTVVYEYDLILCDDRTLFLGHWNDGVI